MNEIPLTDASFSEVLARVAYRLIERRFKLLAFKRKGDQEIYQQLIRDLGRHGWHALSTWVSAYLLAWHNDQLAVFTRTCFIMRARMGMDWRSVAFIDYKATRRRDPRVTNRGVATKATKGGR